MGKTRKYVMVKGNENKQRKIIYKTNDNNKNNNEKIINKIMDSMCVTETDRQKDRQTYLMLRAVCYECLCAV